jgi:hypothetical protein
MSNPRFRLSPAMIVACVALFVAIGGTAFAAFVVSSNSQIAPRTVSGHDPPAGSHSNIISASINGTDLAMGAVSGAKLATGAVSIGKLSGNSVNAAKIINGSVTGNDIGSSTITGANLDAADVRESLGVPAVVAAAAAGDPPVTLFHHGNLTLTGHCISDDPTHAHGEITLESAAADAALLSVDGFTGERFTTAPSDPLVATVSWPTTQIRGENFSVLSLSGDYLEGRVQVAVDWDDFPSAVPFCAFTFSGATEGA